MYDEVCLDTMEWSADFPAPTTTEVKLEHDASAPSGAHVHVVEVWQDDTLEAVARLRDAGRVACLNFANPEAPCWNCVMGDTQEEDLWRRTNLSRTLVHSMYPLQGRTLLSRDVLLLRKRTDEGGVRRYERHAAPFQSFDVVTCAALMWPTLAAGCLTRRDCYETVRRMHTILAAGAHADVLVLGAWGCGAFANPAAEMVHLWECALCHAPSPAPGRMPMPMPKRVVFAVPDPYMFTLFQSHLEKKE